MSNMGIKKAEPQPRFSVKVLESFIAEADQ